MNAEIGRRAPARSPRLLWAAVFLAGLIALAYGGSLANGLVFDDSIFMERDPRVQSFAAYKRLLSEPLWGFQDRDGRSGIHQYYRPLQQLPLVVSNEWFGGAPWSCHAISLLLHFGCCLLLFQIVADLVGDGRIGLAAAAIFAVHPGPSEAVLWVSDFAGLGVAFCTLLLLMLHLRGIRPVTMLAAAFTLSLAAMLCKESGVLIAVAPAVYDALVASRDERSAAAARRAGLYAGSTLAAIAYFALRARALGGLLPGADALELTPFELLINAVGLLPSYLAVYLRPIELNMYRDFEPIRSASDPKVLLGAAIAAGAALAAWISRRRAPAIAFGIVFAGQAVAPYLLVRWPQLNAFAERYLYLPSAGLLIAGAALVALRPPRRMTGAATVVAACALLAWFIRIDMQRTREWRSETSIYERTLEQSARAELIRNNLALRYLSEGRPERGIPIQRELLEIDPSFRSGWHNLGLLYIGTGSYREAAAAFERAVSNDPANATSWLNLGYARDAVGKRADALQAYFRALLADPSEAKAMYNLAVIALELGQPANAREMLERALEAVPQDRPAAELLARAVRAERRAPTAQDRATLKALLDHGRAAAENRRWYVSIAALRAAGWFDQKAHRPYHFLANVYYLMGDREAALAAERAALARAPNNPLYRSNVAGLEAPAAAGATEPRGFDSGSR